MHYIHLTREIKLERKTKEFETDGFKIYWEGFLFIKGLEPEVESLNKFTEEIKQVSIFNACQILSGIFACIVHDIKNDIIYSFSDNIGIYNLFHSIKNTSTSFLNSIKINHFKKSDLNPIAINDFILATSCMGWKTFFNDIKKVRFDEIIVDDGSSVFIKKKNLKDIFLIQKCQKNIIEKFNPIVKSLQKTKGKISLDLSGGLDTRLIASILKYYNLDFEIAISGMPGNIDVEISKNLAEIFGKPHYITYHKLSNNIEKELFEAFEHFDSLTDIVAWHRYYQFQKDKFKRNCELTITGHAGELYKYEFIWNLKNEYPIKTIEQMLAWGSWIRYGISFLTIPYEIFSNEFQNYSKMYHNRIREYLLKNYSNDKSGKTGPKIYVYFMEGSRTTNMGSLVNRYSPLLDRDIIPCGTTLKYGKMTKIDGLKRMIQQPWDDRFTFERKIITFLNKDIAKIRTTATMGYSVSTQPVEQIKRVINYYISIMKKKILKTKESYISPNHPDFYPTVKSLNKTEDIIEILINEGILKKTVRAEDINNMYFGSLFTIGMLLDFCEKIN